MARKIMKSVPTASKASAQKWFGAMYTIVADPTLDPKPVIRGLKSRRTIRTEFAEEVSQNTKIHVVNISPSPLHKPHQASHKELRSISIQERAELDPYMRYEMARGDWN